MLKKYTEKWNIEILLNILESPKQIIIQIYYIN